MGRVIPPQSGSVIPAATAARSVSESSDHDFTHRRACNPFLASKTTRADPEPDLSSRVRAARVEQEGG